MSVQQAFASVRVGAGVYSVNQPAYLTNNWRAVQAAEKYARYSRFIKAMGGILTITNGSVMLRLRMDGIPDGYYVFSDDGYLLDAQMHVMESQLSRAAYGSMYDIPPDPEILRPDFPNLTHTPPISAAEVREMIDFLNHVRSAHRDDEYCYVFFEDSALISSSNTESWLKLSCEFPVNPKGSIFHANLLRLLLTDMLRYEHIFVGRDNRPTADINVKMPLVFGLDWSSCGLLKPGRN